MILEKLCEYAERVEEFPPLHFQRRLLDWLIELDFEGNLKAFIPVEETGKEFLFSDHLIGRAGRQIKPLLLGDKAGYVFGNVDKKKEKFNKKEKDRLDAFYSLAEECYQKTKEPVVAAVCNFQKYIFSIKKPEKLSNNDWVGFRVEGQDPLTLESVQKFWQEKQEEEAKERSDLTSECMVCGQEKAIADRHTVTLKGIPGGHGRGNPLISANAEAFESYGLKESRIAPVCFDCSTLYGRACNHLISHEKSRLYVGDLLYIFWTKNNLDFDIATIISSPGEDEVKSFINSFRTGSRRVLNDDDFYILALSANQSRTVVRDWVETTLNNVRENIANYFEGMKIVDKGEERYYGLNTLAGTTTLKRDDIKPIISQSLTSLALKGTPLPPAVLFNLIKRIKADTEYRVTRPRAALLKLYFNSSIEGGIIVKEKLDKDNLNDAYLCGRLFSVIEQIQMKAVPGIKSTVVDRYYGTASASPASVFGNLMRKAQYHLAKLRKEEGKKGAYYGLQRELEEIISHINEFPAYLTLKDQGLFALGYYQQKSYSRSEAN